MKGDDCCPGEPCYGDPRGLHSEDCPVYLANMETYEASRPPLVPQKWPPQLPRHGPS